MCDILTTKSVTHNPITKPQSAEPKKNPQTTYAELLLQWNALLITLPEETEEKVRAYLRELDAHATKTKLSTSTQQLGLTRETARIETQYTPIALLLDEISASHNSSGKSHSLNALNLDNVRDIIVETNWMRLYLLRINRLFSAISMVIHNAKFNEILKSANSVLHPIFNILSWAYYLPRLTINLAMLVKHTVPNRWMSAAEKELSCRERLKAQWDRRWSELLNDAVWCAVGITTCFFLTGPHAMLLIVALYVFDVMNISAKAYVDIRRYNKLIKKTEITDSKAKNTFIKNLQKLKKQQYKASALNVGTAVGLLASMTLFIPALAACPVIPVIGASMVIATCITYIFLKKAFIQSPQALVKQTLNEHSLFRKKEAGHSNDAASTNETAAPNTPTAPRTTN